MTDAPRRDVASFDAIVVGARIAGCATAYQLARRGWRVALVERHRLPLGPTLSLPLVYARGLEQFRALDLFPVLEQILPHLTPIHSIRLRLDDELVLAGCLPAWAGFEQAYILPREQLDQTLLEFVLAQTFPAPGSITLFAGHRVETLLRQGDRNGPEQQSIIGVRVVRGDSVAPEKDLRAPLTVGADGRLSRVAALLGEEATRYGIVEPGTSFAYTYCRGIRRAGLADGFMARAKDMRIVVVGEIEPGLQMLGVYLPAEQYAAFRGRGQPNPQLAAQAELLATCASVPDLAGRLDHLELIGKVFGLEPRYGAGFFRPPGGLGWALVGDAAHFKDPASAQGLHDALFTVHELLATLDTLCGDKPPSAETAAVTWPGCVSVLQQRRDAALMPMFDFTNTFARLLTHPPSRKELALLRLLALDPALLQRFLGILTGAADFTTFRRDLPRYLVRRLLAHGVNIVGLVRDLWILFHRQRPARPLRAYPPSLRIALASSGADDDTVHDGENEDESGDESEGATSDPVGRRTNAQLAMPNVRNSVDDVDTMGATNATDAIDSSTTGTTTR